MAAVDDVLTAAMIETEREIAVAEAWDKEATPLDNDGDHSMEDIGDGLEGQHEPDDDEPEEGDESEGEEGQEDEGEEGEESVEAKKDGDKPDDKPSAGRARAARPKCHPVGCASCRSKTLGRTKGERSRVGATTREIRKAD